MTTDPVCGMDLEESQAKASAEFEGKTLLLLLRGLPRRVPGLPRAVRAGSRRRIGDLGLAVGRLRAARRRAWLASLTVALRQRPPSARLYLGAGRGASSAPRMNLATSTSVPTPRSLLVARVSPARRAGADRGAGGDHPPRARHRRRRRARARRDRPHAAALREFAAIARRHEAALAAVGTEALRRAPNAAAFLESAAELLGTPSR